MYHEGGYDDKFSYGIRLKGSYGQWGFQAVAAQRYNPDGTYRWTKSGVNKDLPDTPGSLGNLVNTTMALRRSEEHTSELQSLMRISYAVFCLKKKNNKHTKIQYTSRISPILQYHTKIAR